MMGEFPKREVSVKQYREICLGLGLRIRWFRDAESESKRIATRGEMNGWRDVVRSVTCPKADRYLVEHAETLIAIADEHLLVNQVMPLLSSSPGVPVTQVSR